MHMTFGVDFVVGFKCINLRPDVAVHRKSSFTLS